MNKKLLILMLISTIATASLAETTITYQGQLQDEAGPVTDTPDMEFRLFDSLTGDTQVGPMLERNEVPVTDGLFQVKLDFGNVYDQELWLEVTVEGIALDPLQRIAPAPVAVHALNVPEGTLADLNCNDSEGVAWNGTEWVCTELADDNADAWALGGNAGTDPEIDFLGTSDETPFELRIDGQRKLRIEPGGNPQRISPNLVAGNAANEVDSEDSGATISGGGSFNSPNVTQGAFPVIGGGEGNEVFGNWSTVSGGMFNYAAGVQATVGGGRNNSAAGFHSTIGGGADNTANEFSATIGGGIDNLANRESATIGGGDSNTAEGEFATVGGGQGNTASHNHAAVGGGLGNVASETEATVCGGGTNIASGFGSMVGGGWSNEAKGWRSTVAGGQNNLAEGLTASVLGGQLNTAVGNRSTISGGEENSASAPWSTVPGGKGNVASGHYSFAAGHNAVADSTGSFVWADSLDHQTPPVGENGFLARATGGVVFVTSVDASGNPTAGAVLPDGGSNWQSISDRHAKQAIESADPDEVLSRVLKMPISEYSYKSQDDSIRHMGPMAQDFHPLFGLGEDELRISAMNLAGVALAAIQGLHSELEARNVRLQNQEQRIARLEAENAELRQIAERNAELENRLAKLEALLLEDRQVAGGQQQDQPFGRWAKAPNHKHQIRNKFQ